MYVSAWWSFLKDRIYNYDKDVLKGDIIELRHFHVKTLQPNVWRYYNIHVHRPLLADPCCPSHARYPSKHEPKESSPWSIPLSLPSWAPAPLLFLRRQEHSVFLALSGPVVCMAWLELTTLLLHPVMGNSSLFPHQPWCFQTGSTAVHKASRQHWLCTRTLRLCVVTTGGNRAFVFQCFAVLKCPRHRICYGSYTNSTVGCSLPHHHHTLHLVN